MNEKLNYWNTEYKNSNIPFYPSQFAAFVASELYSNEDSIIDIGCGNGRDSAFFADLGMEVIGIDGSKSAITSNNKILTPSRKKLTFLEIDFNISEHRKIQFPKSAIVYSRFFIHAIDDEAEAIFFNFLNKNMTSKSRAFFEFRTDQDQDLQKVAKDHFRRFINVEKFCKKLELNGFRIQYEVNGFGFAKYKDEDAHVCRIVAVKA